MQPLAFPLIDAQLNTFLFVSLLLAVFGGSIASGLSIILGEERIFGIKHQQLASGMSKLSYWGANYLFDFTVSFLNFLLMTAG